MRNKTEEGENEVQKEKTNFFQKRWVHVGLIILLTFGVYANSFKNEFVYDDESYVIGIPSSYIKNVKSVFQFFPRLFTKEYFSLSGELTYRPVATLSYFVYYSLFRSDPLGYRILSVLVHLTVALALYQLCLRLFKDKKLSFLAAIFFVLHPVNTESVLQVSFNEDILACLFLLFSFLFHIRYNSNLFHKTFLLRFASPFLYLLALLSKETALIGLPLFAFYDYLMYEEFMGETSRRIEYFLLGAITVIYLWLRFILFTTPSVTRPYIGDSFYVNLLTMTKVLVFYYLRLLILPVNLRIEYAIDPVTHFYEPSFLVSVVLLGIFILFAYRLRRLSKMSLFFLSWIFISLLPVMNFIPFLRYSFVTEHYLYMSSIGFCVLLAMAMRTAEKLDIFHSLNGYLKFILIVIPFTILLLYSITIIRRNSDWKDSFTLWSKTVVKSPKSFKVQKTVADEYAKRGRFDEAITHYKRTIELIPDYKEAYNNLGNVYFQKKWYDQAINEYKKAIAIDPHYTMAYKNLGETYLRKEMCVEALNVFKKILELVPTDVEIQERYKQVIQILHEFGQKNKKFFAGGKWTEKVNMKENRFFEGVAFI